MNKVQNKVLREEVEGKNGGCYLRAQVLRGVLKISSPLALIIRGSAKIFTVGHSGTLHQKSIWIHQCSVCIYY